MSRCAIDSLDKQSGWKLSLSLVEKYIIQTKVSYSYCCILSERRRNLTQIKIQTLDFHKALKGLMNNCHCRVNSRLKAEKKPSQETNALRKVLNNSHLIFLFWHLVSIKEKSSEDFIKRSMQCVECNPQIRHITKEWNHLTLKTHCKNKELIYCISGRNAYEKELDLQMNWYWIRTRYSPERLYRSLGQPTLIWVRMWIKIDPCPFGSYFALCIFLHWYLQLLA